MTALKDLEAAAKRAVKAYDDENPLRTADFHRIDCPCLRCAIDDLRALISKGGAGD